MKLSKYNIFFSTLNFVLCFVGYPLVTSLFLPLTSDAEGISRLVTVPYRGGALLVSLIVLFLNYKVKMPKLPGVLKIFLFFWLIFIVRVFYDVFLRTDIYIKETSQLWLYIFGICLPVIFSVIKSFRYIDVEKALLWVYIGVLFALLFSLFSNQTLFISSELYEGRMDGNMALNTISFGHLAVTAVILSFCIYQKWNLSFMLKILVLVFMSFAFYIALRAGSRGPIFALFIVLLFYISVRSKSPVLNILILMTVSGMLFSFRELILTLMGYVSPVIESRIRSTIEGGDTSGRDVLYNDAISSFLDSPLLGKKFAIISSSGDFIYSHNIILDAFMGLGVIGGLSMILILLSALRKCFFLVKKQNPIFWIALILLQQIVNNMFSGAFYYNQLINILLVFILLYPTKTTLYRINEVSKT